MPSLDPFDQYLENMTALVATNYTRRALMIQRGILLCDWESIIFLWTDKTLAAVDSLTTYIGVEKKSVCIS